MVRIGCLTWRKDLYKFYANTATDLLVQGDYSQHVTDRVEQAVAKKRISDNPDTQLLEDVSALVFIEHYKLEFAGKHHEYSEEKWLDIIRTTWKKMTDRARRFALEGGIKPPEPLALLIQKAVANVWYDWKPELLRILSPYYYYGNVEM